MEIMMWNGHHQKPRWANQSPTAGLLCKLINLHSPP